MGHADIATTMIYVHHVPQHDAADRLAQLVEAAEDRSQKACPQPCPELSKSQVISRDPTPLSRAKPTPRPTDSPNS